MLWDFFCRLPRYRTAVGNGSPFAHSHIAGEHWSAGLFQFTATLLGCTGQPDSFNTPKESGGMAVELFHYTAIVMGRSGQWSCFGILPHYWEQWALRVLRYTPSPPGSSWLWDPFSATVCYSAGEQLATGLFQYTATLLRSNRQRDSFYMLPHCSGVVDNGTPSVLRLNAGERFALEILQSIGTVVLSTCLRHSFCTLPRCRGAMRSGTHLVHSDNLGEVWAVGLLQQMAHFWAVVGSGPPLFHCIKASAPDTKGGSSFTYGDPRVQRPVERGRRGGGWAGRVRGMWL